MKANGYKLVRRNGITRLTTPNGLYVSASTKTALKRALHAEGGVSK